MPDLAIAIGNSRIQTGIFCHGHLTSYFSYLHSEHFPEAMLEREFSRIAIASVVSSVKTPWHDLAQIITNAMVPISGIYPTMGLDRVLAAWGAWQIYETALLVIDCGTALTFTGINSDRHFVGGAILAGLHTQRQSLNQAAAALPLVNLPTVLPPRWARDTETAIHSGLIFGAIATIKSYIQDWQRLYPQSAIILTGGDSSLLAPWLGQLHHHPHLLLEAIAHLVFSD